MRPHKKRDKRSRLYIDKNCNSLSSHGCYKCVGLCILAAASSGEGITLETQSWYSVWFSGDLRLGFRQK